MPVTAIPVKDFYRHHFKSAQAFAERLGIGRNSVYRLSRKGVLVAGNKAKFTLYYPKKSFEHKEDQLRLDL